MNRIISFIFILLAFNSCSFPESNGRAIKFYNNTLDTIAYTVDGRTYNPNNPHMFDSLPVIRDYVEVEPKSMFYDEIFFPDDFFNNYPDKKTKIYILSLDTLNKYTWKEIRAKSNYMRRYDISHHEMDSLNWTITYP